jgi:Increased loss of mitochondrial DNA protein 1
MPLLSSYLLITTHALTTLTASYFLLTHPSLLTASSPVWIIGESMHIRPPPPSFSVPSEPVASAAFILALAALSQLFFVGGLASIDTNKKESATAGAGALAEQAAVLHASQASWMSLAATRVFVMGGLAVWIYLLKSERGVIIDTDQIGGVKGMGLLANSVVFTAAMGEMLFWGYVWTVLKEEGSGLAKTVMQGREGRNAVLNQDGTVTWE